jgi:hypothetical protein
MRLAINVLAGLVLVLLLVLRRWFRALIDGDRRPAGRLRFFLAPAVLVFAAFLALAIWALFDADYPMVVLLLFTYLSIMLEAMRRRDDRRRDDRRA